MILCKKIESKFIHKKYTSYMIQGLLDLYEATYEEKWISWAYDLQQKQNELFYDTEHGGFFNVQANDESILVRLKDGK